MKIERKKSLQQFLSKCRKTPKLKGYILSLGRFGPKPCSMLSPEDINLIFKFNFTEIYSFR